MPVDSCGHTDEHLVLFIVQLRVHVGLTAGLRDEFTILLPTAHITHLLSFIIDLIIIILGICMTDVI